MYMVGSNITHKGEYGAIQWWGKQGKTKVVKASRKKAIASGEPFVYVWFHSADYSDERWEWLAVSEVESASPRMFVPGLTA